MSELPQTAHVEDETKRRIAENESRFRAANERIEAGWRRLGAADQTIPFVCECGRLECLLVLRLTIGQYEQGRRNPRYFLCAPGHEIVTDGIGRVVQEEPGFVIVEKLGVAGAVAERADPRRDGRHDG
jgi:hypothetical protein